MRKWILLISILVTTLTVYGQDSTLSAKHQKKLSEITDPYARALRHRKYFKKDSIKQAKVRLKASAIKRSEKLLQDSLRDLTDVKPYEESINKIIDLDSGYVKTEAQKLGHEKIEGELGIDVRGLAIDSTLTDQVTQQGKNKIMDEGKNQEVVKAHGELLEIAQVDSLKNLSMDSVGVRAKEVAIKKGEEYLKNTKEGKALSGLDEDSEFGKLTVQKAAIEKTQAALKEAAAQNELKQQMTAKAKDFIMKNASQIQEVQSKMTDLKKKYSAVPNSNDLSTATKRKSLAGEPIWKRLIIGGNFNITKTNPVTLDLSPVVGYRINKLFEVGVSATYRVSFEASSRTITQNEAVYGQGIWANHQFYKNYFGYVEGERMSTVTTQNDISTRSWKEGLLVGIGRKFKVAKWMEMQALVLFNLLYDNQDELYASPVVFRTGFRFTK
jgi:hypothetical protein